MSDLVPIAVDDAIRAALADSDADQTVCLFGPTVHVRADDSLERGISVLVERVAGQSSGPVDVTVSVGDGTVDVRVTGTDAVAAELNLGYVCRLMNRYGGSIKVGDDGVVLRLRQS